jgi:hypothetical protein
MSGEITDWAQAWASDSVQMAHRALTGLKFPGAGHQSWNVDASNNPDYEKNAQIIKQRQLAKGGAHLAQILNKIWP